MPPIGSDNVPPLVKTSIETANSPIETETEIIMFNPNFIEFAEKAGMHRLQGQAHPRP